MTKTRSLYSIDGEALRFHFHDGQNRTWNATSRFVAMIAGTQGGKTSFGPWWLAREIHDRGPGDYLAVSSSYDLFKLKMLPEMRTVFCDVLGIGRYNASDRTIEIGKDGECKPGGTEEPWARVILRSASSPSGLESATAKAAWLDEPGQDEYTIEVWEAIQRRLTLNRGRALFTTTPYNLGWLKTEVYDRWARGDKNYEVVQFASTSNPIFPKEELERARDTMPAWRFEMFYLGRFAKPAGLIYDCVDEDSYVEPFDIPKHWPIYTGVDFGSENTATVWIAEDPDRDQFYLYNETLEGGKTTREHCVKARMQANGHAHWMVWGGSGSEEQQRMDWTEEGVSVNRPLVPEVEAGILRVYSILKPRRLKIFNTCTGIRDEIGSYRRLLDDRGDPTEQIVDKRKYHRLDALRYVTSGMTGGRATVGGEVW